MRRVRVLGVRASGGHRIAAVLAAASISLTASGCWLQYGYDAGHSRHNDLEDALTTANVATLEPAWSRDFADEEVDEPVVRGGKVYLVTAETDEFVTHALKAETGTPAWEVSSPYCCNGSSPFVDPTTWAGDALWTNRGYNAETPWGLAPYFVWGVRIDPADGTLLSSGEPGAGSPAVGVGDDVILATTETGANLAVLDAATRAPRWTADLGASGPLVAPSAPAVVDGQILAASTDSRLHAFPLAGCGASECTPTWTLDLGADITSVVAAGGDNAFATLDSGDLIAVDRQTGAVAWSAPGVGDHIAVADGLVYAATGSAWSAYPTGCAGTPCAPVAGADLDAPATTAPVVAGGVLYVGAEGAVHAFDATGCTGTDDCLLAEIPVDGTVTGLVVAEGRLFVVHQPAGGEADALTAFAPAT